MANKKDIINRLRENSNCLECHVDYKWRQNCCGSKDWIINLEEAEIIIEQEFASKQKQEVDNETRS